LSLLLMDSKRLGMPVGNWPPAPAERPTSGSRKSSNNESAEQSSGGAEIMSMFRYELRNSQFVVVVFYRGSWSLYCKVGRRPLGRACICSCVAYLDLDM
jgi:hypothetical protein